MATPAADTVPPSARVPTKRFGRTGLAMPVLSCGGMRFQASRTAAPSAPGGTRARGGAGRVRVSGPM